MIKIYRFIFAIYKPVSYTHLDVYKRQFTVFIQPPDFGKLCRACGNKAKSPKTIAQLKPNPAKAKVSNIGTFAEPVTALPNKLPKIGPVQENETMTKVNAMKNIPVSYTHLDVYKRQDWCMC